MKLYLIYVIIDKNDPDIDNCFIDKLPSSRTDYINDHTIIKLYGICNSKEKCDKFFKIHNKKKFYIKNKKVSDNKYKKILSYYSDFMINKTIIDDLEIYLPHHVDTTVADICYSMNLGDIFDKFKFHDYTILNDKYIVALDKLLYCSFRVMMDGDYDESQYAINNLYVHGITQEKTLKGIDIYMKGLKVFYDLYKYTLI